MCGGRLKLRAFGGRWTKQAPSSFPDPGFSRPGSAWLRSPALVCKGREAPWALDLSNDLAPHFLPRPGGVHGRRIWPEGRGQGAANAGRRPAGARPTARKAVGRGRPESAQPSVSRPAPPRIPEVGARWLFVCVLFFYLFRVHVRRSEDNLWEFLFSFHHVGPSNRTQIERPGSPSWPTSSCPAGL